MVDVTADLNSRASVCVLARLDYPHLGTIFGEFGQLWLDWRILVHLHKFHEFSIIFTLLDVESERHVIKWIQTLRFVEDLHVVKNSLFVTQVEVVLLVVRRHHLVISMVLLFLLFFFFFLIVSTDTRFARRFIATWRDASVCFLQGIQCLLFCSFWCRDQIFNRRIAFLISWLSRHQALRALFSFFLLVIGLFDVFVRFNAIKNLIRLPLGPQELVVRPLIIVPHRPPESSL